MLYTGQRVNETVGGRSGAHADNTFRGELGGNEFECSKCDLLFKGVLSANWRSRGKLKIEKDVAHAGKLCKENSLLPSV